MSAITSEEVIDSGIPHGDIIIRLVDAALGKNKDALTEARQAVIGSMGMEGLIDVAAVIGTFTMQNRIADATGLPLDAPIEMATRSLRSELGVDNFGAAEHTDRGGLIRAVLSRLMEPLTPLIFRIMRQA